MIARNPRSSRGNCWICLEDCEKVEQYVTELDDECGKMKEDIAAMRKEVNG